LSANYARRSNEIVHVHAQVLPPVRLSALLEMLKGEGSRRFQQSVSCRIASLQRHDERFVDELCEQIEGFAGGDRWAGGDGCDCLQVEAAGKYAKPSQKCLFRYRQERVAPVDHGAQGLMPR